MPKKQFGKQAQANSVPSITACSASGGFRTKCGSFPVEPLNGTGIKLNPELPAAKRVRAGSSHDVPEVDSRRPLLGSAKPASPGPSNSDQKQRLVIGGAPRHVQKIRHQASSRLSADAESFSRIVFPAVRKWPSARTGRSGAHRGCRRWRECRAHLSAH